MINISHAEIISAGGLLAALSLKSAEYASSLLKENDVKLPNNLDKLQRLILHANPHLDEYFAVLLFRACLPQRLRSLPVSEEVLYSHYNDALAQQLWPTSALFGLGATRSGGARPLIVFDEHRPTGVRRKYSSCSEMVVKVTLRNATRSFDEALWKVFGEVDHIDANGGAHAFQLSNLIKDWHDVEFVFSRGASSRDDIKDSLGVFWKQAIIDAVITALVYEIKEGNIAKNPDILKKALNDSIDHYKQHTLLRTEPLFPSVIEEIRKACTEIKNAHFKRKSAEGASKDKDLVLDKTGKPIPQRMTIDRIARACFDCWGPQLGQVIMAHFWEARVLVQLSFKKIQNELNNLVEREIRNLNMRSSVGRISFRQLNQCKEIIKIFDRNTHQQKQETKNVWLISLIPNGDMVAVNRPLSNFINFRNRGMGLFLLENSRWGTRALYRGNEFPYVRWKRIVDKLQEKEGDADNPDVPGCWHKTVDERGIYEGFLLNGNRAHQYVPRSGLEIDALATIVEQDFRDNR